MPSDAKKKRDQKKKEAAKKHDTNKTAPKTNGTSKVVEDSDKEPESVFEDLTSLADHRAVTGNLGSHERSNDIHVNNLSITFHGAELLTDTALELNNGRRYGLIGLNGCGKSTLLSVISNREVPIPERFDIYHLQREMAPSEKSALETVMAVDDERIRLEEECEALSNIDEPEAIQRVQVLCERLSELDASTAEVRAAEILHGLGFSKEMMAQKVKNFSGGWRMRIALARALYIKPDIMLLDEPTNHLDLEACVWLEKYLEQYNRILLIISHSQDFMNIVCNEIIHMHQKTLNYYKGNYDKYVQTRQELEENQRKKYEWEQDQMAHMKDYIARFGHGSAKLARQAKSKEKTLNRMKEGGLTEKVVTDKTLSFRFEDCGKIPPPVIQVQNVSFKYKDDSPYIYKKLEFGVDLDTRVALVGPNGAGKTTLLKLIAGENVPSDGIVRIHSHLKIGRYHQHLHEILEPELSALDWMMKKYPEIKERDQMRKIVGRFGITGQQQTCPMKNLSDGQRCRVTFAWLAQQRPHMLLLDEPTNHLDMETIDALADAINDFNGGMMLVSHDFRLISQVAKEVWICQDQKITELKGGIYAYKKMLVENLENSRKK